jgi:hypothetical protein
MSRSLLRNPWPGTQKFLVIRYTSATLCYESRTNSECLFFPHNSHSAPSASDLPESLSILRAPISIGSLIDSVMQHYRRFVVWQINLLQKP